MRRRKVGALVVIDDRSLVGIFTERDVVFRVVAAGLDSRSVRVGDVMTGSPITIAPSELFGYALSVMHERRFRHLPVVDGETVVGIVSARSALDPELEEFVAEANRRKHLRRPRPGASGARGC
jgi:CBS domain-containing protein